MSIFTGQPGVSHWIFPEQREEYRGLRVLAANFRQILEQEKSARVIYSFLLLNIILVIYLAILVLKHLIYIWKYIDHTIFELYEVDSYHLC